MYGTQTFAAFCGAVNNSRMTIGLHRAVDRGEAGAFLFKRTGSITVRKRTG